MEDWKFWTAMGLSLVFIAYGFTVVSKDFRRICCGHSREIGGASQPE